MKQFQMFAALVAASGGSQLRRVGPMRKAFVVFTVTVTAAFTSCATPPPRFTGISYLGEAATNEILSVSRAKLRSTAPAAYIFRVHIDGHLVRRRQGSRIVMANIIQAWVYYRTGDGPARHLVLEELRGHWRITDTPQSIDHEMPEDVIITGARDKHRSGELDWGRI